MNIKTGLTVRQAGNCDSREASHLCLAMGHNKLIKKTLSQKSINKVSLFKTVATSPVVLSTRDSRCQLSGMDENV